MGESYSRGICSNQFTVEDASKELPKRDVSDLCDLCDLLVGYW